MKPKHRGWRQIDIIYRVGNDSTWGNRAVQSSRLTCGNIGASHRVSGYWDGVDLLPVIGLWSFEVPVAWCSHRFVRNCRTNELLGSKTLGVCSGLIPWSNVSARVFLSYAPPTSSFSSFIIHHHTLHPLRRNFFEEMSVAWHILSSQSFPVFHHPTSTHIHPAMSKVILVFTMKENTQFQSFERKHETVARNTREPCIKHAARAITAMLWHLPLFFPYSSKHSCILERLWEPSLEPQVQSFQH